MKRNVMLVLLLVVPLLVVGFLYRFGENRYDAQNAVYKGKVVRIPGFRFGAASVFFVSGRPGGACLLMDRLLFRMRHLPAYGRLNVYQLYDSVAPPCPAVGREHTLYQALRVDGKVVERMRMELGGLARKPNMAVLARQNGTVVNVYDLDVETMQDTLITEALIVVGQ